MTRAGLGLRSERGPILLSVMLSTGLVAIDSTILATAVPSIVNDLGGFAQFPWLFSVYLLAQAVSVPIYGKFADVVGRKPLMLWGIGLFLLGSVLCGLAWNMPALIVFRAVQGLGAGAVQPISVTIVGDLYTVAERAKVQGYVASVWGISSIVGPTLGGVFSDYLSWRWIFFVNLPVGAAATWMLLRRFHENVEHREHKIDFAGASLLTVGATLFILGLLEGGVAWGWMSLPSIAILSTALLALIIFALVERRAVEPVLPGWIFRRRVLNSTNFTSLTIGVLMIGLTSYVPLYAQGVLGHSALIAGFALAAMTVGWPISASQAGRLYLRIGFRNTGLVGCGFVITGLALVQLWSPGTSIWQVGVTCFIIGLGMGLIASPTLIAAQSVVDWQRRGVVTGTNMFSRSMGSAVGIAVFGAIANASLNSQIGGHGSGAASDIRAQALAPAIEHVFLGSGIAGLVLLLAISLIPGKIIELARESAGVNDQIVQSRPAVD